MTLNSLDLYGFSFQLKVISSLLTHKEFVSNIHDVLSEEYFSNSAQKWIIKQVISYYDKYHCNVSMEVLKVELQKIDNDVLKISIKEQLKSAYNASAEDLKYVQEEFSSFCKNQQLKSALLNSVDLLNAGDYDSIRTLIDNAIKSGQSKNIGHEYDKDIESRYREDHRIIVPTPWNEINDLLQGGLGNGDFGLIFGNPGGGKSWLLVALGAFAVKMGYNVIHYTLELDENYIGRRYDAFFTKIPVNKISESRQTVEDMMCNIPGKLIIKEFTTGKATISTIESHITKVKDLGVIPDLIIIDYVDLLSTKKRTTDRKGELDDIYLNTKGLAKGLQLPVWSVSQVNRAGAKDDVIEGDKSAGSYDKMMITDVSMSLSRKRKDKTEGTGRLHIMKNRYGMDGLTYGISVDMSTGHFEITGNYNEEDSEYTTPNTTSNNNGSGNFDDFDKKMLKNKFFELNS